MAGTPKPIGRILIIPKGNYDPATPYNSLDLVRYDFKSWLCKTDGIIGITPTEGTDWTLMTEDGTDGTDGRGIVNIQRTGTDPSNPLKDIYTITYTDGTTSTFTVTNGSGGGTTADTMLKSVYDKDDDGIVDKADAANTATNATDATNAKNLKKSDGTTISADSINTKLLKVDNKIDKPTSATEGQVLTYRNNEWVADDSQGGGGQFVIIAKGETYEGQTVTATKGTKSKSAVITSGVARIPVDEGGVWTLTLSSGETFNTPNMTYYGEYEVALLNGSTVTPTNDIQMWLKCAGLNKSYTTMSEVLADTNTLSALISNNNAVDYMVRSTTWASDVCSNESAMIYINLNDYCANKLLSDSTWCTAICNSTYFKKVLNVKVPTLTDDSALVLASNVYAGSNYKAYHVFDNNPTTLWAAKNTTNEYVGYDFEKPVYVKKVSYIQSNESSKYRAKNIRVDGFDGSQWKSIKTDVAQQNTNIQWIDLSDNKTSYTKYRMYIIDSYSDSVIELAELQFYGREA